MVNVWSSVDGQDEGEEEAEGVTSWEPESWSLKWRLSDEEEEEEANIQVSPDPRPEEGDEGTAGSPGEVDDSTSADSECSASPRVSPLAEDSEEDTEEELRYERQQQEQWELAVSGEWSTMCQDEDEDESQTERYLRRSQLQKEEEIGANWEAIVQRYASVGVIRDLRSLQHILPAPAVRDQSRRALRQFARLCRGPVPLTASGQTKAQALDSLSRRLRRETRRTVSAEDIAGAFLGFCGIFQELEVLRDRQDRVEAAMRTDRLLADLERRERAEAEMSRAWSSASSASTASSQWRANSRLKQWENDKNLVDVYREDVRVFSRNLITVLPPIPEDALWNSPRQLAEESSEGDEDSSESDFPEYNGMDDSDEDEASY